jgi:hypothetical protein
MGTGKIVTFGGSRPDSLLTAWLLINFRLLLRERLGLDGKTNVAGSGKLLRSIGQDITKSEKEMCNMMAKAHTTEVIKSPTSPPSPPPAPLVG